MSEFDRFSVRIPSGNLVQAGPVEIFQPPIIEPEDEIVSKELLREFKQMAPGSFKLIKSAWTEAVGYENTTAELFEVPELGITRTESAHEVMLGQLIMQTFVGEIPELVAMKPFDRAGDAAHELALSQYFSGPDRPTGFNTFNPLGICRLETTGQYGVITKYAHGTVSLDNIVWNPEYDDKSVVVTQALGKSALMLASMHAAGWTHGDAQIKNIFRSNQDEVFIADLESTRPFKQIKSRIGELDTFEVEASINHDLRALLESLDARSDEARDFTDGINVIFSLIYSSIVSSPQSMVPRELRKSPNDIAKLYQEITNR
jgi:hypothetical protein